MAKKPKPAPGSGDESMAASVEAALADGTGPEAPPALTRIMHSLTVGDVKMLDTACLVEGVDRSTMMSRLIRAGLAGYHCGKTGGAEL